MGSSGSSSSTRLRDLSPSKEMENCPCLTQPAAWPISEINLSFSSSRSSPNDIVSLRTSGKSYLTPWLCRPVPALLQTKSTCLGRAKEVSLSVFCTTLAPPPPHKSYTGKWFMCLQLSPRFTVTLHLCRLTRPRLASLEARMCTLEPLETLSFSTRPPATLRRRSMTKQTP